MSAGNCDRNMHTAVFRSVKTTMTKGRTETDRDGQVRLCYIQIFFSRRKASDDDLCGKTRTSLNDGSMWAVMTFHPISDLEINW